jgi:hypothetical protein
METNANEQFYKSGLRDSLNQPTENQLQHQQANYDDEMAPKDDNLSDDEEDDLEEDFDDDDLEDEETDEENITGTDEEMLIEDEGSSRGTMTAS